jgi:glucuronate isomerase
MMFTSEPSLAQRIERMIGDSPVVDAYCRVPADRPGVTGLAGLLADRDVRVELRGAGMPDGDLEFEEPGDRFVARAIPYLKRMRNTATAWCLYRILRDLYDFTDPHVDETNVNELDDRISEFAAEPGWTNSVMANRANFAVIVTSECAKNASDHFASEKIVGMRDLSSIVSRTEGASLDAGYYDRLSRELGDRPGDADSLRTLLFAWLDQSLSTSAGIFRLNVPTDFSFAKPEASELATVLTHAGRGKPLSDEEIGIVANAVNRLVFTWHHEHGRAVQIAVNGDPNRASAAADSRLTSRWKTVLREFNKARFAFMIAPETLGWDASLLAREFPNAYVAASCWPTPIPAIIERDLAMMIQATPMTKVVGFSSGASSVEWVYGRFQLVKKSMAAAFAGLVDRRYYEEDEISPILRQILRETPRELYGL